MVARARPNPLLLAAEKLSPTPSPYLTDPTGWVRDVCGEHLWSKQAEIATSVLKNRKTAVPACHGPGKSFLAARIIAWWIAVHAPGEALAITTAPTASQVKQVLWRELRTAHRKASLAGRINLNNEWYLGDELVAIGRKPSDHNEHGFQGMRAKYLLIVVDEACGVASTLWTGLTSMMTGAHVRVLAIGNPDDPSAEFAKICQGADPVAGGMSAREWNVIPISLFDTPAFSGEEVPAALAEVLVGPEWLRSFEQDVAVEGEPLYTSKVLGRFPEDASTGVIPFSWLRQSIWADPDDPGRPALGADPVVELGVDIGASDNGDATVIAERRGMRAGRFWRVRSGDPAVVRDKVVQAVLESGATVVKVDATGVGWGVVGMVRDACPNVEVVPVGFSEAASDPAKWKNVRAELWWNGRELSRTGEWDLTDIRADDADDDDDDDADDGVRDTAMSELAAPRYREDTSGRIQIEDKDAVRKRLGRSPDNADALLLAFYSAPRDEAVTYIWN